jgi:hypothetical protein
MRLFLLGNVLGFMIGVAVTALYFAFKTLFAAHAKASFIEAHNPRQQTSPANTEAGNTREKVRAKGA